MVVKMACILNMTNLVKLLGFIILISNANAVKEEEKLLESGFNVVTCVGNGQFNFSHSLFKCSPVKGKSPCESLGLFRANKRRCYKCCNILVNSSKSQKTIKLKTGRLSPPLPTALTPVTEYKGREDDDNNTSTDLRGKKWSTNALNIVLTTIAVALAVFGGAPLVYYITIRYRNRQPPLSQEEENKMVEVNTTESHEDPKNYAGITETQV